MDFRSKGDRLVGALLGLAFAAAFLPIVGWVIVKTVGPEPPGIGEMAPGFSMSSPVDGARIATADLAGLVLLLDFWETTCVGCVGATPKLNRLQEKYADRGFTVVGINREPGREAIVERFMREREIIYPVGIDPGEVSDAYGIHATPTVVLIGADGRIRAKHRGPVTEKKLENEIEAALAASRGRVALR